VESHRFKTAFVVKIYKLGAVSRVICLNKKICLNPLPRLSACAIPQGYSLEGLRSTQDNVERPFEDGGGGRVG
jgi:hypothetical protein